jgi:peptidoglycan/xylan/chitin deacetylase (PgdA/CDA1 family)
VRGKLPVVLNVLAVVVAASGLLGVRAARRPESSPTREPIELAITVDDLTRMSFGPDAEPPDEIIHKFTRAFARHGLPPVTGFVNGARLAEHPGDRAALEEWVKSGNLLGNHSYSHLDLARVSVDQYLADIKRNEPILRRVQGAPKPGRDWRVFRYPFLQEGTSREMREAVRSQLFERGYRIAEVTVDFEDWEFFPTYVRCADSANAHAIEGLRQRYRRAARESLQSADDLAHSLFGRPVRQVLLLHAGAFTADMIDELLQEYESMGVRFISLDDALRDSIYQLDPRFARKWGSPFLYQVDEALRGDEPKSAWPPYPEFVALCRERVTRPR